MVRRHFRARTFSRSSMKRATQQIWVPIQFRQTVAPGAPVAVDLLAGLSATFDVTNRDIRWDAFVGQVCSVPTTAPAGAGQQGTLYLDWIKGDKVLTAAQLDPSTTPGNLRDVLYQQSWMQLLAAAPVAADWAIDPYREVHLRAKRRLKANEETIWLASATDAATQTWIVGAVGRALITVP